MTAGSGAQIVSVPLTTREAERRVPDARLAVYKAAGAYSSTRRGLNEDDTNLKRMYWGLACFEHMNALIDAAAAEDSRDLAEGTRVSGWIAVFADTICRPLLKEAAADTARLAGARKRVGDFFDVYDSLRRSPARDAAPLEHVRGQVRDALTELIDLAAEIWHTLDRQYVEEARQRQEEAMKMQPDDAFPPIGGWTDAEAFKEQARREAVERDRHRYDRPRR